ncbi:MAG TPA: hypothetical protein VMS55_00400 [Myxococcota bacterium]|nr:hypothetical protein [Myxococcota bacterium]
MKRVEPRKPRRRTTSKQKQRAERYQVMTDEAMADFTIEELREFLQADSLEVPVDPAFKERLRRKLWDLLQEQLRNRRGDA